MKLNEISDNPGARHSRKRVGRGIGSGLGKTSGKGQKGQKSRRGVAINGFEGGQMPIYRRLPRRGFTPLAKREFQVLNLDRLQTALDSGRLEASQPLDTQALAAAGLVRPNGPPVKLLGRGELTAPLRLAVAATSASARAAVERAGGSVNIVDGGTAEA